jgi:hypothetical protein
MLKRLICLQHRSGIEVAKNKSKYDDYSMALDIFTFELQTVRELNRLFPKSIQTFKKNQEVTMLKKMNKLDLEQQAKVMKVKAQFKEFLKKREEGGTLEYKLDDGAEEIATNYFINGLLLPDKYNEFLRNMSLVYVIVEFEAFLQSVLETTFNQKPQILRTCDKNLHFGDLLNCEDLGAAKKEIIDKEIYEIINSGIVSTGKYFDKVLVLKIQEYVNWTEFIERFYRRNILVHNRGMVNKEYRKATGYSGKMEYMKVTGRYLDETIDLFEDMSNKLTAEMRLKFI